MDEEILARVDVGLIVAAEHAPTFELFFQEQYEGVYGSLCLITRNRHEAEEIAQDAFVRMWERWDRVDAIADPVAYVHSIAMNAFRRRSRRATMAIRRALRMMQPTMPSRWSRKPSSSFGCSHRSALGSARRSS